MKILLSPTTVAFLMFASLSSTCCFNFAEARLQGRNRPQQQRLPEHGDNGDNVSADDIKSSIQDQAVFEFSKTKQCLAAFADSRPGEEHAHALLTMT